MDADFPISKSGDIEILHDVVCSTMGSYLTISGCTWKPIPSMILPSGYEARVIINIRKVKK